ncbi:MAG: hypothetical protein EKK57_00930 [Proteobacteria bacterium]|nr:MAG: hypothetical protein EKK57_00930 [Pseudomonadota bacterium]
MADPKLTFLVLDFKKEQESELCLRSIRNRVAANYKLVYLDNGSGEDYPNRFRNENLADLVIQNPINTGCGNGIDQLVKVCETEYFCLVQSDQFVNYDLSEKNVTEILNTFSSLNAFCIDLAGAQAGIGIYSERAHIMRKTDYLSIYRGEDGKLGGPGPFHAFKHTEQYIQEYFKQNNIKVLHISPPVFQDNGKWAIRELPCGGILKHSCDEKRMYVIKQPLRRSEVYPPLNDSEWELMLSNKWIDGTIPEAWKPHSFTVPQWN